MGKNVIVPNIFKVGAECKGQTASRKGGSEKGVLAVGGAKTPFSYITKVNGVEMILGLGNDMFMRLTDEQKQAMKNSREHARSEDWLDVYSNRREDTAPLFHAPKPQKFKRTPVTEIRKESPRPYFNQKAYEILLKVPEIKMEQARKLASNPLFAEAYLAKVKQIKSR